MNNRPFSLLLVDDERHNTSSLRRLFKQIYKDELEIHVSHSGIDALKILGTKVIDLAVIDLRMPEMDGFTLLRETRKDFPEVKVLILTAHGTIKDAVKALEMGAVDFLEKPFQGEELKARLDHFIKFWHLNEEHLRLKEELSYTYGFEKLVGTSPAMLGVKRLITQAGPSEVNVLILGETGTGKELVARALHYHSKRRHEMFVPIDCASLSETVAESELFGYMKGSFTGAYGSSPGLLRAGDKGTVFFDEIGELPLGMQTKLLRALQEREVRPVGSTKAFPIDIRILASTNRDLEKETAGGGFREDLYYRLNVLTLKVPPLRERREDIPSLVHYFLKKNPPAGETARISEAVLEVLERYDWPGNVRELENVLRRAVALKRSDLIDLADLPPALRSLGSELPGEESAPSDTTMEAFEVTAIRNALVKTGNNKKQAAALLGIGEATLYRKIKRYRLP